MKKLNFVLLALLSAKLCRCANTTSSSSDSKTSSKTSDPKNDYPAICDSPPSVNIDPEKCCNFPRIFDESIVTACENETMKTDKAGDLVTDSCIIECMFNKSGLNRNSSEQQQNMIRLVVAKLTTESAWNKTVVTKAVDDCFDELSDDDMREIVEHVKSELSSDSKSIANKICHPQASLLLDCFYRELYKVCPREMFENDSVECSTLRNYTNTCNDW